MNMLLKELSTINMKLFFFDFYREAFFTRIVLVFFFFFFMIQGQNLP